MAEQTNILSFRLSRRETDKLKNSELNKVVGINSLNQLVRKLVLDFNANRLIYLRPNDKLSNPSLEPAS